VTKHRSPVIVVVVFFRPFDIATGPRTDAHLGRYLLFDKERQSKEKEKGKRTSGVNFINVKGMNVSYERRFGSFY